MTQWKFGVGQTPREEQLEIRRALAAGQADRYLRGQAMARMRDDGSRLMRAELERRRARKRPYPNPKDDGPHPV